MMLGYGDDEYSNASTAFSHIRRNMTRAVIFEGNALRLATRMKSYAAIGVATPRYFVTFSDSVCLCRM
jgi:hypothetical protein